MTTPETDQTRPAAPELEFCAPDCPLCGRETNPIDDVFTCEQCDCHWNNDGTFNEWQQTERCTSVSRAGLRCMLDLDLDHRPDRRGTIFHIHAADGYVAEWGTSP